MVRGCPAVIIRALPLVIREARSTRKAVVAVREPENSSRSSRNFCAAGPKLPLLSMTNGTKVTSGRVDKNDA